MNKFIFILLFSVFASNAQNKSLIKDTFYNQHINAIDHTASEHNFEPKERVHLKVNFKVDKNGEIFDVEVSKDDQIFEEALKSIVSEIPKLSPEEFLYKGDTMSYKIKLGIKLPSKRKRKKIQNDNEKFKIDFEYFSIKQYFPLKNIDISESIDWKDINDHQLPLTESCKNLSSQEALKQCISSEISSHVNRQFDVGIAAELGLTSGRYEVIVKFYISKDGEIINITAEGAVPELREEGIRVINTLPKFLSPAKLNGKPVILSYAMPVRFVIA